jgi:CHAD domain-containing protein
MALLRQRAVLARRQASRAARAAVADPAYAVLMLDLTAFLSSLEAVTLQPLEDFAGGVLAAHLKKAKKRARHLETLDYAQLHQLRIALKRLRYAMEFFEPLWPKALAQALAALSDLQDRLGRLNDAATAWKLLDGLAVESTAPEYQQAVGYLRGWTAREAEQCRDGLARAWKAFIRLKPAWR